MKRKRTSDPAAEASKVPSTPDAAPSESLEFETVDETPVPARAAGVRHKAKATKCVVCAEPCTPNAADDLCWVCRRLKLSAWRDTDAQMPAQE